MRALPLRRLALHRGPAWRAWCAFVALGLLGAAALPAHAQVDERAMKAAYLYNFIQFAQWPVQPEEPFLLCVLGRTPLDEQLAKLEGKKVLNDVHVKVLHVGLKDSFTACHALYLDDTQRKLAEEVLPRLESAPILTITDSDGLADKGMMIEIQKRDLKLGFEVNLAMARKVRISFNARMLKMANYVAGAK